MKKNLILCLMLLSINHYEALAFDDEDTHPRLSKAAAQPKISGLNLYLKNSLGVQDGINQLLTLSGRNPQGYSIAKSYSIFEWLWRGSREEDRPMCRAMNHFLNPLKPWDQAYMTDVPWVFKACSKDGWTRQYSNITWATGYKSSPPNGKPTDEKFPDAWDKALDPPAPNNWNNAREYYYKALTNPLEIVRQTNFAKTFQAVGQVMHLLQDVAVPAHVRNDFQSHLAFTGINENNFFSFTTWFHNLFEFYLMNNADAVDKLSELEIQTSKPALDNMRLTDLWSTNTNSTGMNPSGSLQQGLAEYTNANFVSDLTFTFGLGGGSGETTVVSGEHSFPYPNYSSTEIVPKPIVITLSTGATVTTTRQYRQKVTHGATGYLLAGVSYLEFEVENINPVDKNDIWKSMEIITPMDDKVHADYAKELIPRAIGYSAELLNYFFRGDVKLDYQTGSSPGYVVVNSNANEKMEGLFSLYYDTAGGQRNLISSGTVSLSPGVQNDVFDFIPPQDAKEPGKYILAFKGKLGNEDGAVVGKVFSRVLDITLPDSGVYAMVNADQNPAHFTQIKAKVRSASTATVQGGTIQAVAKFKNTVDDITFRYAVSAPQSVTGLSGTSEFTFDFTAQPIPINATDLYLQVIFKGQMGDDTNATAIGLKDISEPTPIDLFNNMDRVCIIGSWYVAGSQAAIDKMNEQGKVNEWDVYPHAATDIYVKISSSNNPQDASFNNKDYYLSELGVNAFRRLMYILTDKTFTYSVYSSGRDLMPGVDPWVFLPSGERYAGTAVKNQTDMVNDPAACSGAPPCYPLVTPTYYNYRGNQLWWGGSLIFTNEPCPAGSVCPD